MNHSHHICKNEEDTKKLAIVLASALKANMIIFLQGDLGAGKTTLVRFILQALGYKEKVKSPTYNLVEIHEIGGIKLNHFDLYRFGSPEEWFSGGFDEYLSAEQTITLIEWPEKIRGVKINPDIHIQIKTNDQGERIIDIQSKVVIPT